jgi:hypothetical protein
MAAWCLSSVCLSKWRCNVSAEYVLISPPLIFLSERFRIGDTASH